MRKTLTVLHILLVSVALADAPPSVGGLVYSESHVFSVASDPAWTDEAYQLQNDGTYLQIFRIGWSFRGVPQYTYAEPADGKYTYEKTGATTAKMVLSPSQSGTGSRTINLIFSNGTEGSFQGSSSFDSAKFRLSDPSAAKPLANASSRTFVRSGKAVELGFVLSPSARSVLVRAVGPGLEAFGVSGILKDPRVSVFPDGKQTNDNWEVGNSTVSIERLQSLLGAFPLKRGSKDAALIVHGGGPLTVVVEGGDSADEGEVLLEVYLIP